MWFGRVEGVKMLDKKTGLMAGVFGGVGIAILPIFLGTQFKFLKYIGYAVMFCGILYFVAGDVIFKKRNSFDKEIQEKIKMGVMTQEQAWDEEKKKLEHELMVEKHKIELEKMKLSVEEQKADIAKKRASLKTKEDYKFPDVLGNISNVVHDKDKKKKDSLEELKKVL